VPIRRFADLLAVDSTLDGVLPNQHLEQAIESGVITTAGGSEIPTANIQPASLDLRLGPVAYRLRCSFLPDRHPVEARMTGLVMGAIDLTRDDAVLDKMRPYLIPLKERLQLPPQVRARANPKSSTGRADVFTRVICDRSHRFDEIPHGYDGPLYLEVVPLSFAVKVHEDLSLNQLRLSIGRARLTDDELIEVQRDEPDCSWASTCRATGRDVSGTGPGPTPRCSTSPGWATSTPGRTGSPSTKRSATGWCSSRGTSTCSCPTKR